MTVICRAFIDLEGAFDRANKGENYLEKCQRKVLDGFRIPFGTGRQRCGSMEPPILKLILRYATGRGFQPRFWMCLWTKFKGDRGHYILLQCDDPWILTLTLSHLETLCTHMDHCHQCNTKLQTTPRVCMPPIIDSVKIKSCAVLYMQLSFTNDAQCIIYVRGQCVSRLAALLLLAHSGHAVAIPMLRISLPPAYVAM